MLLQRQDQQAFSYLYDNYAPALNGIIFRLVEDSTLSEDILQEAFMKIWNNFSSYDKTKGRLFTWMMNLTSALGLSPLGAYHAMMYGRSLYFDIAKAQAELNWQPRFSTNQMFVQSYEWYLRNRETILRSGGASHHRSAVKQGLLKVVKHLL